MNGDDDNLKKKKKNDNTNDSINENSTINSENQSKKLYRTIRKINGDPFKAIKDGDIPLLANIMRQSSFNINVTRYPSGWTLLHRAAEVGNTDICELLIEHGAKVNQRTTWGWYTPFALALSNGYTETAKSLLHRGADPDIVIKEGKTAFDYACSRGHENLIKDFRMKMDRFLQALRHEKRLKRLQRNQTATAIVETETDLLEVHHDDNDDELQ